MIFTYHVLGMRLEAVVNPKENFICKGMSRKIKKQLFQIGSRPHSSSLRTRILQNIRHMFTDPNLDLLLLDKNFPLKAFFLLFDLASVLQQELSLLLLFESVANGERHIGYAFSSIPSSLSDIPSPLVFFLST